MGKSVDSNHRLRISFLAAGMGLGGAEKQFLYMLRALHQMDVSTQVLTLTKGEAHEHDLQDLGITPIYIKKANRAQRILDIRRAIKDFRPHFFQGTHFYANFYTGIAGRLAGITSIGAVRTNLYYDLEKLNLGPLGPWLLRLPSVLLVNSHHGKENAIKFGVRPEKIFVLHNVIDLDEFDSQMNVDLSTTSDDWQVLERDSKEKVIVVTVARLMPVKRLERFLLALALARRETPQLRGWIVGSGPEEFLLKELAESLDLLPDGIRFLGARSNVPQLLARADMFVVTSDQEGFPNVLLEAMAASLPVITTPAGEAPAIIRDNVNGHLVGFDDLQLLSKRMVQLSQSEEMRRQMGKHGRKIVESHFNNRHLALSLAYIYQIIAREQGNRAALSVIENLTV